MGHAAGSLFALVAWSYEGSRNFAVLTEPVSGNGSW
jgi:hypothetical protein